jgi:hypothetical protein
MTKSSVAQQNAAGAEVKGTPIDPKLVITKAVDREAVDAINPSISPAPKPVYRGANNAEILPNPINPSSTNRLSENNTVSSALVHSAAGDRTVKPPAPSKSA